MRRVFIARRCRIAFKNWSEFSGNSEMSTGKMSWVIVRQRANESDLVGVFGQLNKVFADLHSRNSSGNGLKGTSHLRGGIRFQVKSIQLTRATPHEQKYTSLSWFESAGVIYRGAIGRCGLSKARQIQTQGP